MKRKISLRILSMVLVLTLFFGIVPSNLVFASDKLKIDNEYIEVTVPSDGSAFGINTLKGNPSKRFDDNQPLLYDGDDKFATSYTTVRIIKNPGATNQEVRDYVYGSSKGIMKTLPYVHQIDGESKAIVSVWSVDGVDVTQYLTINGNTASAHGGYVNISYSYNNTNAENVGVGIRVLLDTKIAGSDGGQFFKNGGNSPITKEIEFNGDEVPEWYSISDSVVYSTTTAYGLLKNNSMNRYPDTVQMAHWFNLANTMWDYTVNGSVNFDDYYNEYQCPDSAISIIFNPELVASNETKSIDTMYGVGELNGMESASDYCVMTLTQDKQLKANSSNTGYENNGEITLYVTIDNSDKDSVQIVDGKLKLVFEDKLVDEELTMTREPAIWVPSGKEEDETISVGAINRGEIKRNIPIKLKARPVYVSNSNPNDIVYKPTPGYTLKKSIDTRKIVIQLTGDGTPIPSVASKIITMPSLGESVDIGFTGIDPKTIYYEGYSYFSVQGTGNNFGALADKSNWTAYLKNVVTGEIINMDSFNCSADVTNKQLGLLVDMKGRLGEFELTIEFKNSLAALGKKVFSSSSDHIKTSSDEKYKNRGYSIAVIARETAKKDYAMKLFSTEAGKGTAEEQFEEYKEAIEDKKGEILIEARGVFKILYKEGSNSENTSSDMTISTNSEKTNSGIIGFETIPGSDNIKLNRIMYYNAMTPLTFKADFNSSGKPTEMRVEGDGDLSIINASTIWKHKFMIRIITDTIYSYTTGYDAEEGMQLDATLPQLQLLGGGWLLQNMGGFIFTLNYGELGCQDGRYTINFSGSVSFPLGMNKSSTSAASGTTPGTGGEGGAGGEGSSGTTAEDNSSSQTGAGEAPQQTTWVAARPSALQQQQTTWVSARPSALAPTQEEAERNNAEDSGTSSNSGSAGASTTQSATNTGGFTEGNASGKKSAADALGMFNDGGSFGITVDSILFGEHEDRDDKNNIKTGFVGLAASVEIELPASVFPAGGKQNNDSTLSEGASAANPTPSEDTVVDASSPSATTAEGQNQNARNAKSRNLGKLNAFSAGVSLNTYEFSAGVDLGIGIGPLSSAFRMSLGETGNGKICLDNIYFEIKGFTVPIVPGIVNLQGLGGGISNLAKSVNYKGEARPPVTVNLMGVFDLVKVMVMQADLAVSGNGLNFSITGAPKGFDQIKFIAKGDFDWTTGFSMRLSGTVDLFSGIVIGNVCIALTTDPQFFMMGKIDGSLNIPDLGTLAGVTLAITNDYIAGGAKILIFSGGFVYYYDSNKFRLLRGNEIDELANIDLDSQEMSSDSGGGSEGTSQSFLEVRSIYEEDGSVQLMGIGAGAKVVSTTVDSRITSTYSKEAKYGVVGNSVTTNITDTMIKGNDVVLRMYYEGNTAPQFTVSKPNGQNYPIVEYDYSKTQEQNNQNGANMLLSEKDDGSGNVKKYAYINIGNTDLMSGNWTINSTNGVEISDYTVLTVPTVTPKLTINSASISGTTLTVDRTADDNAKITVLLIPCDDSGKPVIETVTDVNGNSVQNEHPGYIIDTGKGSGTTTSVVNIPSGKYIVRVDSILNDSVYTYEYTNTPLYYTNPNTLAAPQNVNATAGGDGRLDISSSVPQNATGIQFDVYKRLEGGGEEKLTAIGGYVGDENSEGKVTTYFKGENSIVDENGVTRYTSEIKPGETYFVRAYAVNINEGSGYFTSEAVQSADVTVPIPVPPQVSVNIVSYDLKNKVDDDNQAYLQASSSNVLLGYEITNFGTEPNDEVTVRFDIDGTQYGNVVKNTATTGSKGYAAFSLSDGEHTVDIVLINKVGDVTVETRTFSVDTTPADIKIEYPQNGSFFDPTVGVPIKLTTDDSVTIDVYLDEEKVVSSDSVSYTKTVGESGSATYNTVYEKTISVSSPNYSHEVKIVATDKNGNKTEHIATVVNKTVAKIGGIKIKGNATGNDVTELTAVCLDEEGNELDIGVSQNKLTWTLLSDPSYASMVINSGNSGAVILQNNTQPFSVMAQWPLGGDEYLADVYDSGVVGEQSQGSEGGTGGGASSKKHPNAVLNIINKVKEDMSPSAEVNASKIYAGVDFVAKQDGNAVFKAGKDISSENYAIIGTDKNTVSYENSLDENCKFRSDILQLDSLNPLGNVLIDLELTGEGSNSNIGIYRYAENINKWIYVGGSLDEARNMMSVTTDKNGRYAIIENPRMSEIKFADIDKNWAELYINSLAYAGFIDGSVENGTRYYKPQDEITRGEFIKLLVSAKGADLSDFDVSMFADREEFDDWVIPYAAAAYNQGWLKGETTERGLEANLSEKITRQDAVTLVYRVFFDGRKSSGKLGFADSSKVSDYAIDSVSYLVENGIISGFEDGTLKPLDSLLREQIAKILWMSIFK